VKLIEQTIRRLKVRPAVKAESLWMYPLIDPEPASNGFQLAMDAFAEGTLQVTEVSEGGTVPTLKVNNGASTNVLLLDGEELIGAKQNRVLNVTVLIQAKMSIEVPVSCVEQGRWSYRSRKFRGADWILYADGRAKKMRNVHSSLKRGFRDANQGEVWDGIAEKSARLSAASPTGAHEAMYAKYRGRLDEKVDRLRTVENQVGAVFAINGRITGLELLGTAEAFAGIYPKIVRSYAIDALDPAYSEQSTKADDVQRFLDTIAQIEAKSYDSVGLGNEVRLEGRGIVGAGLCFEDRLLHLSVLDDREVVAAESWRC